MENASKALLIAGGVLVAMLVLAIGVILISTSGEVGSTYYEKLNTQQIQKFNSRFLIYDGKKNIKSQEIVSLVNYVISYNKKMESNIEVNIDGCSGYNGNLADTTKDLIKFIKENSTQPQIVDGKEQIKIIYFECSEINYDNEGMINKIKFTKIS